MQIRPWLLSAIFASAVLAAGCNQSADSSKPPGPSGVHSQNNPNVDVGQPLYKRNAAPNSIVAPVRSADPVVVPACTVMYEDRQQVSAEVDAKIELLATRLPNDASYDPKDPNIVFHPREANIPPIPYRKLNEGDSVRVGQVICRLDDQLVTARMDAAHTTKKYALEGQVQAKEGAEFTRRKLKLSQDLFDKGTGSLGDLLSDQVTLSRFLENVAQGAQTIAKADADFKESQVMLQKHMVTSSVNGIVRTIAKRPGEFVKTGDKILEIQATDKVRVEGNLDVQYANRVKRDMIASVEPALLNAPAASHAWHRQEVTGIAVTGNPGRPLVVSTSIDGSALVWDPIKNSVGHILLHPVAVRSVACSPPGSRSYLAVTGADDGKVRIWDLSNPDNLPKNATKEPTDVHTSGVQAVAFSPDGKYFATAAGREVFIWEADSGKKLYTLPHEHREAVTSLSFTPQATLVTASKDRTIKIWKLGAEKGASIETIDFRSGVVDVLGVSRDGGRVLFDQDKARIDLVNLADKQTVGQVQNQGSAATFATFALLSPEETLLVTGGGEGEMKGGVQVWLAPPPGGHGAEVARLITPARSPVTCAAFSPVQGFPFLAVGTSAGTVHYYPAPDPSRARGKGKVSLVDSTDPRDVTVRVEMENTLNLLDRSAATVIIDPVSK